MNRGFVVHGDFACFWKGPLSQWHLSPFAFKGERYFCAEQAMMRCKADLFGDREAAVRIMAAKNPAECKRLGRMVRNFDPWKWNAANMDIVRDINFAKFSQNPELAAVLMGTGDLRLVEASPYDKIWGVGLGPDDPNLASPKLWLGENRLGRVLTMVRDRLCGRKVFTVAATGHRPQKLYGYDLRDPRWLELGRRMRAWLIGKENCHRRIRCISGMALGVDQLFALVALKLRDQGHDMTVVCAIPCRDQNRAWKSDEYWRGIMARADEHVFVHDGPYTAGCMEERNRWMVGRADEILAVWDGSRGGTGNCVAYARGKGKRVVNIYGGKEELLPAVEIKMATQMTFGSKM